MQATHNCGEAQPKCHAQAHKKYNPHSRIHCSFGATVGQPVLQEKSEERERENDKLNKDKLAPCGAAFQGNKLANVHEYW